LQGLQPHTSLNQSRSSRGARGHARRDRSAIDYSEARADNRAFLCASTVAVPLWYFSAISLKDKKMDLPAVENQSVAASPLHFDTHTGW